ncbi:MAG: type II secretion system protein [Limisphaerales bacterium]
MGSAKSFIQHELSPVPPPTGAFTLLELICVIAIIGILAALLLPVLGRGKAQAQRVHCASNLRQLGIAFHIFMHDHGGKFPMQVPMAEGGSQEFVQNGYAVIGEFYFAYRHFQVLSNENITPELFVCPMDKRPIPTNLCVLQNENISYFVGVNADYSKPDSMLAGDRNITNASGHTFSIVHGGAGNQLRWTKELHEYKGNVLFADGHVEELNNKALAASPNNSGALADFFLPSVKPGRTLSAYNASYNPPPRSSSPSGQTPSYSSPGEKKPASEAGTATRLSPQPQPVKQSASGRTNPEPAD